MNMCRTCLRTPAEKDVSDLEKALHEENQNFIEIMLFCLGIEIAQDSKMTRNLCDKCYRKIISFYKFKVLSLKNEAYLKSLDPVVSLEDQVLTVYINNNEAKHENFLDSDELGPNFKDYDNTEIKVEIELEHEDIRHVNSDKKLPGPDQEIKYEYIKIENAQICKKSVSQKKESSSKKVIRKKESCSKKVKPCNVVDDTRERQMCEECGMSVLNLAEHSMRHQPKDERRTMRCKACPKLFCSHQGMSRHYKATHLGIRAKCDICNKELSKAGLASHMLRKHNPSAMRFECVMCEQRFVSKCSLDTHMPKHTGDRPFECDICHKSFSSKNIVSTHIRQVHLNERNFQCDFCPKAFFEKNALQEHLRTHTRERVFKCDDCEKSFWTKASLRIHRVSHRSFRSYRCDVCDRSFLRLGSLKDHMITHTKEKLHPCQFCGVRFGRSTHRLRHERTVHRTPDRPCPP